MAIPTRTDGTPHFGRTLGRRPIVLARLPHVGVADLRMVLPVEDYKPAEAYENVEIAATDQASPASRFVDRSHVTSRTKAKSQSEGLSKSSRPHHKRKHSSGQHKSKSIETFAHASQPIGLAAILCKFHSLVAPFSGAIVALALVASAGLMYWMIISPDRASIESQSVGQDVFGASGVELPEFALQSTTTPVSETNKAAKPWWDMNQEEVDKSASMLVEPQESLDEAQTKVPLEVEQKLSIEEPAFDPPSEANPAEISVQIANGPGELSFPTTARPTGLDFSRIGVAVEDEDQTQTAETLPEVAHRTVPHVLNPTKR